MFITFCESRFVLKLNKDYCVHFWLSIGIEKTKCFSNKTKCFSKKTKCFSKKTKCFVRKT